MLNTDELVQIAKADKKNIGKLRKKKFRGVAIDSRTVKKDEIFFAIKGDRTDGHKYLDEVFSRGVSTAVVSESWYRKSRKKFGDKIILTAGDTILALGEFAKLHRKKFDVPVLCIGGSNGKTTTKDLTAAVLSRKYNVLKSEGNFNNHIGLPLTLLRLSENHDLCVLEVGCNHFGEIKYLCGIAEPGYGLITNIGREHLEFFRNKKGVAKAEFELFDYLKKKGSGICMINEDDDFIRNYSGGLRDGNKFSYSYRFNTDVKGRFEGYNKDLQPEIKIEYGRKKFKTNIPTFGKHSVYNGLAAAAAGLYFKVSPGKIREALQSFKPASSKRMEIVKVNGMTIINDTYNSNPESVQLGLEAMMEFKTSGRKYAVLSDMLELGKASRSEHAGIGKFARKLGVENLYTYGKESFNTFKGAGKLRNNFHFESKSDLTEMLKRNIRPGDILYVKGSRGMKMEEVVKGITEN